MRVILKKYTSWEEDRTGAGYCDTYEKHFVCDKCNTTIQQKVGKVSYNFCPWCGEPIDKENFVDPYREAILKGIEDANNVRFPSGKLKNGQKTIIDNLKRELDRWDTKGEFSSISDCLKVAYITEDQNEFFRSRKLHEEMQHEKWKHKEEEKARRREERERNKRETACS